MIIGITGTIGAGKGVVVKCLVEQKGFHHISARAIWTKMLNERGLPVNRDTMAALANDLRAEHGPAFFVEKALTEVSPDDTLVVIESIRTVGEAELLKQKGGVLLAVDAPQDVRFQRIHGRGSALDDVTFDEFKRQEAAEMCNDDPNKQNIRAVMGMADYTISNSESIDDLHMQVTAFLQRYLTE